MSIKRTLYVDILIFIAFLAVDNPSFTGMSIHEWLSLALTGTLVVHLVLHWNWLVNVTRSFFRKSHRAFRLDYIVDGLFFIAFTTVMLSGLLISREILPSLNIGGTANPSWRQIHSISADASLILLAVHFAFHWNWIVKAIRGLFTTPLSGSTKRTKNPADLSQGVGQR